MDTLLTRWDNVFCLDYLPVVIHAVVSAIMKNRAFVEVGVAPKAIVEKPVDLLIVAAGTWYLSERAGTDHPEELEQVAESQQQTTRDGLSVHGTELHQRCQTARWISAVAMAELPESSSQIFWRRKVLVIRVLSTSARLLGATPNAAYGPARCFATRFSGPSRSASGVTRAGGRPSRGRRSPP